MSKSNQSNKKIVRDWWTTLQRFTKPGAGPLDDSAVSSEACWHGPAPINALHGTRDFIDNFWQPLLHSFPDLERQTHLFFGGESNGRRDGDISLDGAMWVTGTGYLNGTFKEDYLGIPATDSQVNIRWGEFCKMQNDEIVEVYFLLDYVDLMQQAGFEVLPPSLGTDGEYPPPEADDGVMLTAQDSQTTAYTLEHIHKFIFDGLNSYDESEIESMGMADYFHPNAQWYGPGGIGACHSFREFENYHQIPWLQAYPDREVQDLDALFAEGNYSGGPGWAGVKATHTGEYKGVAATGNSIEFNGLDWWKRDQEQIIENWVFVDMVHLFQQFGVDLFERMAEQAQRRQAQ